MRFSIRSRTSMVKARTVPRSSQLSGTTLVASPACTMVTEITPASTGFLLRLMMVWKVCTIWQAIGTGSMPVCGSAAWPPLPRMVIRNSLVEAITGPGLTEKLPTGMPGQLCMPNTACIGNCSNRPSSIITRAPPPPSSAGWKIRYTVPSNGRCCAKCCAAASSMAVWPSWPQACILPWCRLAWAKLLNSCIGRGGGGGGVHLAVVGAGRGEAVELLHGQGVDVGAQANGPTAGAAITPLDDADHAGLAQPPVDRNAPLGELLRHHIGGAPLFEAQLGVGVDVPAHCGNTGRLGNDGVNDVHGSCPQRSRSLARWPQICQPGDVPIHADGADPCAGSGAHAPVAGQHRHFDKLRSDMAGGAERHRKARDRVAADRFDARDEVLARDLAAALRLAQALGQHACGQVALCARIVGLHLVAAFFDGIEKLARDRA